MYSDLMRASRKKMSAEQIGGVEARKPGEVSPCRPSSTDDCHALSVSRIPRDWLFDRDSVVRQVAPRQRRIPPNDLPRLERRAKHTVCAVGFGYQKQSGRFLVQPMDDPLSPFFGSLGKWPAPPLEGVHQRARPVAWRR